MSYYGGAGFHWNAFSLSDKSREPEDEIEILGPTIRRRSSGASTNNDCTPIPDHLPLISCVVCTGAGLQTVMKCQRENGRIIEGTVCTRCANKSRRDIDKLIAYFPNETGIERYFREISK